MKKIDTFELIKYLSIVSVVVFLAIVLFLWSTDSEAAGPVDIDPDATPNGLYLCDIPITLGDSGSTVMPLSDVGRIDFEVSNDNQVTWTAAGNRDRANGDTILCSQTYTLSGLPDGTYFYRSFYTHINGQIAGYTETMEVKLERPLILLPMTNPRFQANP